jgi:Mrp family chromosome partitioning ATPase
VDGVLIVVRAGTTDTGDLEYAMVQLANVRAPVLGVVLNDVDVTAGRYGYGGNYRYYQYYYSDNQS